MKLHAEPTQRRLEMESQEIKTWKDCYGLAVSREYDPEKLLHTYYETSIFNGDMRWSFDDLEDALDLAKALRIGFNMCFEFHQD
jgi:hypothetical protein